MVNLLTRSLTTLAPWRSKSKDPVFPYLHSGASEETDEMKDGMRSYSVLATDGGIRLIINRSALNELPVTFMCDLSRQKRADKWTVLHKPMPDLNSASIIISLCQQRADFTSFQQSPTGWLRFHSLSFPFQSSPLLKSSSYHQLRSHRRPLLGSIYLRE